MPLLRSISRMRHRPPCATQVGRPPDELTGWAHRSEPAAAMDACGVSGLLSLPVSFGAIFLGETLRCFIVLANFSERAVAAVGIKIELQTERCTSICPPPTPTPPSPARPALLAPPKAAPKYSSSPAQHSPFSPITTLPFEQLCATAAAPPAPDAALALTAAGRA